MGMIRSQGWAYTDKIAYAPGVFDLFHIGHLNYLKNAAMWPRTGDSARQLIKNQLIVGVQDDRSVLEQKGFMPNIPLAHRMELIRELWFVDDVISYRSVNQGPVLKHLGVDLFCCGEDYGTADADLGQQDTINYCNRADIRVVRLPRTEDISSTELRVRAKQFWQQRGQRAKKTEYKTVLGSFSTKKDAENAAKQETDAILRLVAAAGHHGSVDTFVELGCGDGRLLQYLAKHFKTIYAVDFLPELLDIAEHRVRGSYLPAVPPFKIDFVSADVQEFQLPHLVDIVLISGVLVYLDDAAVHKVLGKVSQYLRPGGLLILREPLGIDTRIRICNQYSEDLGTLYSAYYRTGPEIEMMLKSHNLATASIESLFKHHEDTHMVILCAKNVK